MAENGGGVSFPVVFFDGERETNVGCVTIHPSLKFKSFKFLLRQMIGISPNHLTAYLVDNSSPQTGRKILITSKANFSAIAREKGCFILVVQRPTRRIRRLKSKQHRTDLDDCFQANRSVPSPENFLLLRRNQPEFGDYDRILRNLQIQRENYAMAMTLNEVSNLRLDLGSIPRIEERFRVSMIDRSFCEECENANKNGTTAPFHWCVYDVVTVGFRSSAGPIARPCGSSWFDRLPF